MTRLLARAEQDALLRSSVGNSLWLVRLRMNTRALMRWYRVAS